MSQSASCSDLIGSYKPIELSRLVKACMDLFLVILYDNNKLEANSKFSEHLARLYGAKAFDKLVDLLGMAVERFGVSLKEEKNLFEATFAKIEKLNRKLFNLKLKLSESSKMNSEPNSACMLFDWVDGALVEAIKNGSWVLLDEINLAPLELLERISPLLEPYPSSITIAEKGDINPIKRNKNFRLFAAMNPATDVGKRALSNSVRSRFTEFYVDEPILDEDLVLVIEKYLGVGIEKRMLDLIINLYKKVKRELAVKCLVDGNNKRPVYSLRTLCRALSYTASLRFFRGEKHIHKNAKANT